VNLRHSGGYSRVLTYPTWQIADLPGNIVGFAEDGNWQALVLQEADGTLQQWRYVLPARWLFQRETLAPADSDVTPLLYAQYAEPLKLTLMGDEQDGVLLVKKPAKMGEFRVPYGASKNPPVVQAHNAILAVMTHDGYRAQCRVVDLASGVLKAELTLLDVQRPVMNLYDRHVMFGDSAGRLIDIDCATGVAQTLVVN
jgi:hypothetical protein